MNIFLSLTPYRVSIILPLTFFFLVIKDWSVSAPFSHLAGGMKYQDGKLTVPTTGRYYIYLQIYCITARKSPCSCKQPSHHHDSITCNLEYHVRRWSF